MQQIVVLVSYFAVAQILVAACNIYLCKKISPIVFSARVFASICCSPMYARPRAIHTILVCPDGSMRDAGSEQGTSPVVAAACISREEDLALVELVLQITIAIRRHR